MVATERKRQGEIATAGCYSACYITLRNILILSVFFFLPAPPLLIARKHFFISFPLLLHLPLFFAYGSEHIKNRSACHHGGQKSFDSPATFVTITRGEWSEGRREKNKKTRNLSRVPPWLLSTLLIVSGSVEDATFSSPLLSIWCHRKWNFISYSAAITLDRAYQDKADSYLQICFSCGTINHRALAILHTCFSRQLFWGVCTVNWLLQGSQGLWYAMLASLLSPLLSPRIDSTGRSSAKWEQHLALLLCCYTPPVSSLLTGWLTTQIKK